jgi:ethanolamine utilization protein EutN
MLLARVVGNVVATQKNGKLEGSKLLLVQPVDLDGAPRGAAVLAIDAVDAGVGDRVLLIQDGRSAQLLLGRAWPPWTRAVVGVVDAVEVAGDADGRRPHPQLTQEVLAPDRRRGGPPAPCPTWSPALPPSSPRWRGCRRPPPARPSARRTSTSTPTPTPACRC